MKTACTLHSIQTTKAASNPISTVLAPFRLIKSRLLAMWRGEEASAAPEATKDAERNGAVKVIKDTKTSEASETPDHPEHTEKPACLETVENRKDKSEDKDSLKDNDGFENDEDEDEDEYEYEDEEKYEWYQDDGEEGKEEDEKIIVENDIDENDPGYIILKDFVVNDVLVKDKCPLDATYDHMDLAVRLVKSVEQQGTFFPVPIDVLCLAAHMYSKRKDMYYHKGETMRLFRRRLRQAMRYRHAMDKHMSFHATFPAINLAYFISILRYCSRSMQYNATSAKPTSIETVR